MDMLRNKAALALVIVPLFGCSEPKPQPAPATVTTTRTTKAVTVTTGMKGSEAISLVGIPCDPATVKAIEDGSNVTLKYQGRSYVFSQGVLQAVQ